MPTLRFRRFEEIPPEDQEHVNFLRARIRGREEIDGIFGAQAHWPAYMASDNQWKRHVVAAGNGDETAR
jgi:hypothetical protein